MAKLTPDLISAHTRIRNYIDNIRNKEKRSYAERYYQQTICNGISVTTGSLTYMGAQAVRIRISKIIHDNNI